MHIEDVMICIIFEILAILFIRKMNLGILYYAISFVITFTIYIRLGAEE